jgi:hypothetical protein
VEGKHVKSSENNSENGKIPRVPLDWESIEREYRAGQLSVVEVGRIHGCSHTAINKRAKRFGWTRDLAERVRQEVSARLVSDGVSAASLNEAVAESAARVVQIVREHRKDIGAGRSIVRNLFAELAEASERHDELEDDIVAETADDARAGRRTAMLRAVSLSTRAGVAFTLSSAMKNLVVLEREAFGLEGVGDGGSESLIRHVISSEPVSEEEWIEKHGAKE